MDRDPRQGVIGRRPRNGYYTLDHLSIVPRLNKEQVRRPIGRVVDETETLPSAQGRGPRQSQMGRDIVLVEVDVDIRWWGAPEGDAAEKSELVLGVDEVRSSTQEVLLVR